MKKDVAQFVEKCLVCQKIKQNIKAQLENCNQSRSQNESESRFPWISWWVYLKPPMVMMRFG